MNIKRAVVTGATGTIGTELIQELIVNNIEVLVLVRPQSSRNQVLLQHPKVKVNCCDQNEYDQFDVRGIEPCDVFFHLAWAGTTGEDRNNMELQCQNIACTLKAVDLARRLGCSKFVGVGSQAEYGRSIEKLKADTPVFPETGYGYAKHCAGLMAFDKTKRLGMEFNWVRVLSVYGAQDSPGSLIKSVISALKEGNSPKLTKGDQVWDFLYGEDAAKALIRIAQGGKDGKTYVLGSGQTKTIKEYVEIIRDIVAPDVELVFGEVPYANKQIMYLCADISELSEDTGWVPQFSFVQGIQKLLKKVDERTK